MGGGAWTHGEPPSPVDQSAIDQPRGGQSWLRAGPEVKQAPDAEVKQALAAALVALVDLRAGTVEALLSAGRRRAAHVEARVALVACERHGCAAGRAAALRLVARVEEEVARVKALIYLDGLAVLERGRLRLQVWGGGERGGVRR